MASWVLGQKRSAKDAEVSGGSQLIDATQHCGVMDSDAPTKIKAERLRLHADLWRRDAKNTANLYLSQLILRSAYELEEEAAELDRRVHASVTQRGLA